MGVCRGVLEGFEASGLLCVSGSFDELRPSFAHIPNHRGSKYPIFEVSCSKNHTLNGIWDQRP